MAHGRRRAERQPHLRYGEAQRETVTQETAGGPSPCIPGIQNAQKRMHLQQVIENRNGEKPTGGRTPETYNECKYGRHHIQRQAGAENPWHPIWSAALIVYAAVL